MHRNHWDDVVIYVNIVDITVSREALLYFKQMRVCTVDARTNTEKSVVIRPLRILID
jgi:hypothetical protein